MRKEKKTMDYYVKLYHTNEAFKQYVDRCAESGKESVDQMLQKYTIREVGKYYAEKEKRVKRKRL